jgi:hypothetical protein
MRARGIETTAATFGALLGLASEAGAWARVVEAWGWLQASGLPVHVGCANTYLGALLKLVREAAAAGMAAVYPGVDSGQRPRLSVCLCTPQRLL